MLMLFSFVFYRFFFLVGCYPSPYVHVNNFGNCKMYDFYHTLFFKFDSKLCSYWLFLSEKRFPLILLSHCENRLFLRFKGKNQFNHSVRPYIKVNRKNKVKSQTSCSHLSQKLKNMLFNEIARSILK